MILTVDLSVVITIGEYEYLAVAGTLSPSRTLYQYPLLDLLLYSVWL